MANSIAKLLAMRLPIPGLLFELLSAVRQELGLAGDGPTAFNSKFNPSTVISKRSEKSPCKSSSKKNKS